MKKIYKQGANCFWQVLLAIGLLSGSTAWAQSIPDIEWTKPGSALAVTTDGNLISTEHLTKSNNYPAPSVVGDGLVKYSLQGNQIWRTGLLQGGNYLGGQLINYDFEAINNVTLAAPTTDGGIAIVGRTSLRGEPVATKISASGTPRRWEESDLFFPGESILSDLIGTPDGGFLLLYTHPVSGGTTNVVVRKYDVTGKFSWFKQVNYPTPNPANPDRSLTKGESVINTPDGGYLIVGYYNTTGVVNTPANSSLMDNTGWVAKLDNQGNIQWQKLLNGLPVTVTNNSPVPGAIVKMVSATDVMPSADGTGYALVGAALGANSETLSAAILELDWNGTFKRAKSLGTAPTKAFIVGYPVGSATYYAVGNTALVNGTHPQILKVSPATVNLSDPALFSVISQRIFDSSPDGYLQALDRAGDGSLVFSDGSQIVKLKVETPPPGTVLTMSAPTYNCQTGAIRFNTSGGDGSPITYLAPGISRASATDNSGFVESGLRGDPKVIPITASQSGRSVTFNFDLKGACSTTATPKPPVERPIPDQFLTVGQSLPGSGFIIGQYFSDPTVNVPNYAPNWFFKVDGLPEGFYVFSQGPDLMYATQPSITILGTPTQAGIYTVTVTAKTAAFPNNPVITSFHFNIAPAPGTVLTMSAPTYNCQTGAIRFNTSGGDGSPITYLAPGISRASATDNSGFVESGLRGDPKVIPITASQSGRSVTFNFDLKGACGQSRVGLQEPEVGLQVRVLGNPVVSQMAELEIRGAEGQRVDVKLVDRQGRSIHQRTISQAGAVEPVSVPLSAGSGLLLLQVHTAREHQTVKLIKP